MQSPAQPAQPRSAGVRRAQAFSGRGLTFWLQWLTANVALTLLLVTLANIKTGSLDSHYRILVIVTLFGSVPIEPPREFRRLFGESCRLGRLGKLLIVDRFGLCRRHVPDGLQ